MVARSLHAVPDAADTTSPLLTVPELVALLAEHGIVWSSSKVYQLLEADILPRQRVGQGEYIISRAEILDWIQNGRLNRWRAAPPAAPALRLDDYEIVATIRRKAPRGIGQ